MASWAAVNTEIQRLRRIQGVDARHRTINGGANNFQLHVVDRRRRGKNQVTTANGFGAKAFPGRWSAASTGQTSANISDV